MTQVQKRAPRLVALRHHDFRLMWAGQLISTIGTEMQFAALNWHIMTLLRGETVPMTIFGQSMTLDAAALGLGATGLARVIPILLCALPGGLAADALDRRRILLVTQSASGIIALALGTLTLRGTVSLPAMYALIALGAMAVAFDNPARQSLVPRLVPREHLANAVSLNTLMWQIATIAGPALAGTLMGLAGLEVGMLYVLNGLSFFAVVLALLAMRYRGAADVKVAGLGGRALLDGFRFTFDNKIIWSTMLLDFLATFFSSARAMLPLIASDILGLGVTSYGVLATAQSVGAVAAGVVLSWRRGLERQGPVLLTSVVIYGAATALLGLSGVFAVSCLCLAVTGAADTVSTVIRGSVRQLMTPDSLRGRMTAVNMVFFMGGPQLGELEAGLVAAFFSVPAAIVSGGIATMLLTAWIARRYPMLRTLDDSAATDAVPG